MKLVFLIVLSISVGEVLSAPAAVVGKGKPKENPVAKREITAATKGEGNAVDADSEKKEEVAVKEKDEKAPASSVASAEEASETSLDSLIEMTKEKRGDHSGLTEVELTEKIFEEEQDIKKLMKVIIQEERQMGKMLSKIEALEYRLQGGAPSYNEYNPYNLYQRYRRYA